MYKTQGGVGVGSVSCQSSVMNCIFTVLFNIILMCEKMRDRLQFFFTCTAINEYFILKKKDAFLIFLFLLSQDRFYV